MYILTKKSETDCSKFLSIDDEVLILKYLSHN